MPSVNQTSASETNYSVTISQHEYPQIIWKLRSIESTFSFLHNRLQSFQEADDSLLMTSAESSGFTDILSESFEDLHLIIEQLKDTDDDRIQEIGGSLEKYANHAGFISNFFLPRVEVNGESVYGVDHKALYNWHLESVLLLFNEICRNGLPVWITSLEETFARGIAGNSHIACQASDYDSITAARIKAVQPKFKALYDKYIFPGGSQLLTDPKKLGTGTEALRKEIWELQNQMPVGSEESMDCGLAIDQLDFLTRLISTGFAFRESDLITLSMIVDQASHNFSRALEWLVPDDGGDLVDTVH